MSIWVMRELGESPFTLLGSALQRSRRHQECPLADYFGAAVAGALLCASSQSYTSLPP